LVITNDERSSPREIDSRRIRWHTGCPRETPCARSPRWNRDEHAHEEDENGERGRRVLGVDGFLVGYCSGAARLVGSARRPRRAAAPRRDHRANGSATAWGATDDVQRTGNVATASAPQLFAKYPDAAQSDAENDAVTRADRFAAAANSCAEQSRADELTPIGVA